MPSTYSSLLRLELMATGEKSATWGDITNTNLGTLLEKSIAGTATVSVTAGNVSLTALNGADDEARCAIINITGTPGVSRNVVAPSTSKTYCVINGSNAAVVFKGAATTGVTLAAGERSWVCWNGSDFVRIGVATDAPTFTGTTTLSTVALGAGSAGSPSYTFTGDLNNGWWAPAADTQAWSIAGAELMRLNATGLGIGVAPTYRLDVTGGAGNGVRYSGPTAQVLLGEVGNIGAVGTLTSHALQLIVSSTERVRIDTSGNVGIGAVPSGFKLDFGTSGAGTMGGVSNIGGYSDAGAYTIWGGRSAVNGGYVQLYGGSHATNPGLVVLGSTGGPAVYVSAAGKVGLGSSPTYDFDLSKSVAGSGVISRVRNASNAAGVTYGLALVESDVVSGGMTAWSSAGTRAAQFWVGTGSNHSVIIGTNDTERVLVDTSGRVRINGAPAVTSGYLIARVAADRNIGFYDVGSVATIQAFTDVAAGASLRVAGNTLLLSGDNGGTSAVQIDPSSRVGINRAPTTDRLEVQGATLRWGRFGSTTANVNYAVLMRADDTNALGYFGSGTGLIASGAETDFVMRSEGDLVLARSSTVGLRLISDGRLQIPSIHNNASGAAGTTPMIASGTFTPTGTTGTNCSGVTPASAMWIRVGSVVTVFGNALASPTATGAMTFFLSLPIASNLANQVDLSGVFTVPDAGAVNSGITGDTTNDRAQFNVNLSVTGLRSYFYTYSYEVK